MSKLSLAWQKIQTSISKQQQVLKYKYAEEKSCHVNCKNDGQSILGCSSFQTFILSNPNLFLAEINGANEKCNGTECAPTSPMRDK